MTTTKSNDSSFFSKDTKHLLCGGVAGCTSRTAVAPLERLKILYQVQDVLKTSNEPKQYGSMLQSLRKIIVEEGWKGLFKGNGANCVRVFPYTAIQFAMFEKMRPLLLSEGEKDLSPLKKLLAGSVAGVASVIVTYPLDFIRARITVPDSMSGIHYNGIWHALRMTVQQEGIQGLYRGMSPTVVGIAPYVGLNFMVFESLRQTAPLDDSGRPDMLFLLGCGAVAGACGQSAAYPFDLMRRRFQMTALSAKQYNGTMDAVKTIYQQEGIRGFYKGLVPNSVKVIPSIAVMFVTNEAMKRWIM
ncbi:Mitochondrial Carrier (MC) Family [Thraustotheca clavata]|uniref:Mitochondrial Carrier (MC) Family n=1 Tax=Thraustotheca clavata TaxID=74557 RepID=A0A1V9ZD71_9STRA|nr:Mitochondrial Carrier (MC) Family [Thraustotheca clavata]